MFTKFPNKEKAIESKEILNKLCQGNKNIKINKNIVEKFCDIMNSSDTDDIQRYSILINQLLHIEYEGKYKDSEAEYLNNYNAGLFDIFELGQVFYENIPTKFKYGCSNFWSEILRTEIYNVFITNYLRTAIKYNPNYAKDVMNFIFADELDSNITIKLKIDLLGFNNKYCEDLQNKLNKIDKIHTVKGDSNVEEDGKVKQDDEIKKYEKIEEYDKKELFSQLDDIINKGKISKDAIYTFKWAQRNARDYNLLNALDNAMKIILQLKGYDLIKLSENNNK